MAEISGSDAKIGFKVASTVNTAVACGAGDGFAHDSFTYNENPSRLDASVLGLGLGQLDDVCRGADAPTCSVNGTLTFQDAYAAMIASFFGVSGAPTEQNLGEGDYLHRMTYGATRKFGTLAVEDTTTTTVEYPSAYPTSLGITLDSFPAFLRADVGFTCTKREDSSSTNTNATLANVTVSDDEYICAGTDVSFQINTETGGALSSGDHVDILSYDLQLQRPMRHVNAATGASTMPAPVNDGMFAGTLTVVLRARTGHTWLTAFSAGTRYKAQIEVSGTQIGAGANKKFGVYLPRLKMITDPDNTISDAGVNTETLVFEVLAADAAPTGMDDNQPYVEYINEKTTAYIS